MGILYTGIYIKFRCAVLDFLGIQGLVKHMGR